MVFPAANPDVGDVMIYEDGEELIVIVEKISHGHFACYESSLSTEQREDLVIEQVVDFLEDLFSDKILLWASETGAGGWTNIKDTNDLKRISEWKGVQELINSGLEVLKDNGRYYLWSGPVNIDGWE